MDREEIIKIGKDLGYELVIFKEFDEAIIGLSFKNDKKPVVAYDQKKCVEIIERLGNTYDEALKIFEAKVLGAEFGENSPVFILTGEGRECYSRSAPVAMYM